MYKNIFVSRVCLNNVSLYAEYFITMNELHNPWIIIDAEDRYENNWIKITHFNVLNPSVIIEVLSAGTRGYDKREKFQLYRAIPTLKEYILVDSTAVLIEAFFFNANRHWELTDYRVSDGALKLHTLGIEVGMKDIYEGTNLIK